MSSSRKRRALAEASPSPPATRRRRSDSASEASSVGGSGDDGSGDDQEANGNNSHDQMVKKLVRLALANEYPRQPLRRADISAKALGPHAGRAFKTVFAAAQKVLMDTFGMTLTELPTKEKVTMTQKRTAIKAHGTSQGGSSSSKAYILTSTLPSSLRTPTILPPSKNPSAAAEATYTGLYTFIVGLIYLTPEQRCGESKLEAALRKVNASEYALPGEKTDKVLKRMEREGYIVKIKEREAGGEETVDWMVGPRGKVEIGERGVAGLVMAVYNKKDMEVEELWKRLEKSLGNNFRRPGPRREDGQEEGAEEGVDAEGEEEEAQEVAQPARRVSRRGARKRQVQEDEDEEEQEEEDGEEGDDDEDQDDSD